MAHVTVIGGGIAGLAAVETARTVAETVSVYDATAYDRPRRGAWGELVRDFAAFPVDRTLDGVVRPVDHVAVYTATDDLTHRFNLTANDFVLIDRGRLEIAWANRLAADPAVTIHGNTRVSPGQFDALVDEADLVIDASGPVPLTANCCADVTAPTDTVLTVSATATGEFGAYHPIPAVVADKQTKLFISTKAPDRATYGVGWAAHRVPADPIGRFNELCVSAGVPQPPRSTLKLGREPVIGSRPVAACCQTHRDTPVRLVGDAAGLVDGLNRFGMNRAVASAEKAVRSWAWGGSYRSWLRRHTRRIRLQSRLVRPIEDRLGATWLFDLLGKVSETHPVTRF